MQRRTHLMLLGCLALSLFQSAPAREVRTDHPLITSYEGSEIRRKEAREFDEYDAFMGMDESTKTPITLALEGKVTKIIYTMPKNRSILEVFRNYQQAMDAASAEILYTCNQKKKECVKRYAGRTLQEASDIHSISNRDGQYLLGKLVRDNKTAYVAIAVGKTSTTVHVIEVKAMETGLVVLDAAALGQGLDGRGHVVVEGIYFDTNQATIQPRSKPALDNVAELLGRRPQLHLFVVGHTDAKGAFAYNVDLSERRAKAVVSALVQTYAINPNRLFAHGVGPLAPAASNTDERGRAKNRRVVIVVR
ncbi:MAG: OmpA family protein [Pseudomonadota bacterium]